MCPFSKRRSYTGSTREQPRTHTGSSLSRCTHLKSPSYRLHLPRRFVALEPLELLAKGEGPFCLPPLVRVGRLVDTALYLRQSHLSILHLYQQYCQTPPLGSTTSCQFTWTCLDSNISNPEQPSFSAWHALFVMDLALK